MFTVHPYLNADLSAGWRFTTDNFEIEAAYNLWGRPKERLELVCPFPERFGIAGNVPPPPFVPNRPSTASLSSIGILRAVNDETNQGFDKDANGNPVFIPITLCDLDFDSGASAGTITHRLHIAGTVHTRPKEIQAFLAGGVFYEFPHQNTALKLWGAWIKAGISF